MTTKARHVNYSDIGLHTADKFGHSKLTESLTEIVNDPPLASCNNNTQLLALMVYQQAAIIQLLKDELTAIRFEVTVIRKELRSKTTAREQAAKAEEKAAKAREKAAMAETEAAKASEPISQIQIQAGDNWDALEDRIRRKF